MRWSRLEPPRPARGLLEGSSSSSTFGKKKLVDSVVCRAAMGDVRDIRGSKKEQRERAGSRLNPSGVKVVQPKQKIIHAGPDGSLEDFEDFSIPSSKPKARLLAFIA